MKKAAFSTSVISVICTCIAIFVCICANPTTVAAATDSATDINTIVDMVNGNDGRMFMTTFEAAEGTTDDFRMSDVVNRLLKTSADGKSKMYIPQEFIDDFQTTYCNTENQKMMVYEDIITGETTVFMKHPKGYATQKFDYCHGPEDIQFVLAEFNYQGFRYTIYINDVNAKACIAKTWDPQENSRVYDCTEIESEILMDAVKKKLNQAFTEGTEIDFIQEPHNGYIHGFVNNNGVREEYVFERYNQKPFGEQLPEIIVAGIEGETKQDDYSLIVEDGAIRVESGKRSGWLDYTKSWFVQDFFAR